MVAQTVVDFMPASALKCALNVEYVDMYTDRNRFQAARANAGFVWFRVNEGRKGDVVYVM